MVFRKLLKCFEWFTYIYVYIPLYQDFPYYRLESLLITSACHTHTHTHRSSHSLANHHGPWHELQTNVSYLFNDFHKIESNSVCVCGCTVQLCTYVLGRCEWQFWYTVKCCNEPSSPNKRTQYIVSLINYYMFSIHMPTLYHVHVHVHVHQHNIVNIMTLRCFIIYELWHKF